MKFFARRIHGAAVRIIMVATAAVAVLVVMAGCGSGAENSDAGSDSQRSESTNQRSASRPAPTLPSAVAPTELTGGICGKLSYQQVERVLGVTFTIAAPHRFGEKTQSCTLAAINAPLPNLTLAFVPGKLDAKAFDERIKPDAGKKIAGLGTSAYTIIGNGNAGTDAAGGPVCEVGWFNDTGSFTMVLTTPMKTSPQQAQDQLGKLVELAKTVK